MIWLWTTCHPALKTGAEWGHALTPWQTLTLHVAPPPPDPKLPVDSLALRTIPHLPAKGGEEVTDDTVATEIARLEALLLTVVDLLQAQGTLKIPEDGISAIGIRCSWPHNG